MGLAENGVVAIDALSIEIVQVQGCTTDRALEAKLVVLSVRGRNHLLRVDVLSTRCTLGSHFVN